MKIGNVEIKNGLCLGPMAGVTDLPFRLLCKEMGCGLTCTEMVSAKAILYKNKNTKELLKSCPEEGVSAVQLFGSDPDIMAEIAAKLDVETDHDIIDVNMGCPVPKIVNNGEGSALMKNPKLVGEILSKMVKAVKKPVTVKFRKGFDDTSINATEIAKVAEDVGVAAVAVHGRTRAQFYSGKADWDIIADVKRAVKIPVIGNGDIFSGEDAKRMLEYTGCDGIMVGRGAKGNPWIFREISTYLESGEVPARPSVAEIKKMIIRQMNMMIEEKGEFTAIREMRKHISWYTAGAHNSTKIRKAVNETVDKNEIIRLLDMMD